MKFSDMPYARPDRGDIIRDMQACTHALREAVDGQAAKDAFTAYDKLQRHVKTLATIVSIRHTIDTRDAFYEAEEQFWNETTPVLAEYEDQFTAAMLESPHRATLEEAFGHVVFVNAELERKAFSPDIIGEMQEENKTVQEYEKLLANARIPFEGNTYTISEMTMFKTDPDDARRMAAWKAEGKWYKDHQNAFDSLYDRLVHLRDTMAKKLGCDDYRTLGYYRMTRNCYTKEDIERFRQAVVDYLVPVAADIFRQKAARFGKTYPMSFADNALWFKSGNPCPKGSPEDILQAGQRFYDALSPETGAFFRMMREQDLMDVLSKEGKRGGGYMTSIPDYEVPFIFANFNGTKADVEVVTHEAGHAFAGYINRKRVPYSTVLPSMEACEVHSMSMEYFAEDSAEAFFGDDADKYRYSHLVDSLTFIPYGTMVDHFQHIIYEKPGLTPDERHAEWKRLLGIYMPWMKLDGEIPFYAEGEGWQRQHHIYSLPFYYIDYCLAQTVALYFWSAIRKDRKAAWETYMAYTKQGGSDTFTAMLEQAGIGNPFEGDMLKTVCEAAKAYLEAFDLTTVI